MAINDHLLHMPGGNIAASVSSGEFWELYGVDAASLLVSLALVTGYYVYLAYRTRKDPTFTVQAVNMLARREWVDSIMREPGKEVLAVQTLRNSTMAATFLASTAVLLIVGVLTLSAQGDKMEGSWHALNIAGSSRNEMWMAKLLIMLLDLLVAFFSFSMAVRVFNHVGYMINVPLVRKHAMLQPAHVAAQLNRAGSFYSLGMRAYYFCVPLVFWLFGPLLMMLASLSLVMVLYRLDRAADPELERKVIEALEQQKHEQHAAWKIWKWSGK